MGATTADSKLQDYAIIAGVTYSGGLASLKGTLNDAAAFLEWLVSPDGGAVPLENIRDVSSPSGAQGDPLLAEPDQDTIDFESQFVGVGSNKRPYGRRLYFYFAGHGFGMRAADVCMLMTHAGPAFLNRNISLSAYRRFFQEHAYFEEVIFVLDCCRNPAPPAKGVEARGPTLTFEADKPRRVVGDLVILAAANGEKAHEIVDPKTQKTRGLFTLALLDVLNGPAGVDEHGRHTGCNLEANLRTRMKLLASSNGGAPASQEANVEMRDRSKRGFVLRTFPKETVPVRIIAPAGDKGDLVVLKGTTDEIARRPVAEVTKKRAPWLVALLPGKSYSVRLEESTEAPLLFAVIDWAQMETTKKDGHYVFVFPDA